ncbi:MAG: hypothetical protein ACRCV7_00575, partial [Culicoidibacterales bacterium]
EKNCNVANVMMIKGNSDAQRMRITVKKCEVGEKLCVIREQNPAATMVIIYPKRGIFNFAMRL